MIDHTHPDADFFDALDEVMGEEAPLDEVAVAGEIGPVAIDGRAYAQLIGDPSWEVGRESWRRAARDKILRDAMQDRGSMGEPTVHHPEAAVRRRPGRSIFWRVFPRVFVWAFLAHVAWQTLR